jgi:hypothetical protein
MNVFGFMVLVFEFFLFRCVAVFDMFALLNQMHSPWWSSIKSNRSCSTKSQIYAAQQDVSTLYCIIKRVIYVRYKLNLAFIL